MTLEHSTLIKVDERGHYMAESLKRHGSSTKHNQFQVNPFLNYHANVAQIPTQLFQLCS